MMLLVVAANPKAAKNSPAHRKKNNNARKRGKENTRSFRPSSTATSNANRNYSKRSSANSSLRGSVNNNNQNNNAQMKAMHAELEDLKNENQALVADRDGLQMKLDGVAAEHEELSNIAKDIEKERDFYFNKVVAIENLLKAEPNQDSPLLKQIYEILYEAAEDEQQQQQPQNDHVMG